MHVVSQPCKSKGGVGGWNELTRKANLDDSRPTFQFFKSGQKVAELKGASAGQIEQLVKKHQGDGDSAGGSSSSGGASKNNYGIPGHVSVKRI